MNNPKLAVYRLVLHQLTFGSFILVLCVIGPSNFPKVAESHMVSPTKTITAVRINSNPPEIDGVLDDMVWHHLERSMGSTIHEKGWTAEYKIPYYVLRFRPKNKYAWGIEWSRSIEVYHQDIKQFVGVERCMTRKAVA